MSEPLRVALTFDAEHPDRPSCPPGATEAILGLLADASVVATFFIQARWATSQPTLARRIADDGHLIGHHSKFHAPMTLLSDEGIRTDVLEGAEEVAVATGRDPRPWFRSPFGDGHDDARLAAILAQLGYRDVHWDIDARDWEPARSPSAVEREVIAGVHAFGDGAVVLLHAWPGSTVEALPRIIDRFCDAGISFVSVLDLGR